jgi:glutaconate CoA-transferase subunit A
MPNTKLVSMREAVERYVADGCILAIEGFTAFICFAAAHEIIRQRKRDLVLCRLTPDLIYDQMIAAGVARKLIFSYLGNPGVGSLHAIRRAVELGVPRPLEIEEYSHFGMVGRYMAGAADLPFFPLRSYIGSDMPAANDAHQSFVDSPYGDGPIAVVPPLKPDVAFVHAQRADAHGNTQLWGLLGMHRKRSPSPRTRSSSSSRKWSMRILIRPRPQPHAHPRPDRRCRRPRTLRRAPQLRPGLLRPRQRLLSQMG